ncbi:MAG: hypothetical protein RR718_08970, partial [Comamonas sp.]
QHLNNRPKSLSCKEKVMKLVVMRMFKHCDDRDAGTGMSMTVEKRKSGGVCGTMQPIFIDHCPT